MKRSMIILSIFIVSMVALPAQDWALEQLNESPRHHEWVTVDYGDREVYSFVVYPEVDRRTPAVVVIHENRGLTDWVRTVADDLAAAGYIAIAPDLLSGLYPQEQRSTFAGTDAAREVLYQLPPEQITADLEMVVDYVRRLPASNGTVAVSGFCWGGSQTFRFATTGADIAAAYVFYGSGPDQLDAVQKVRCPVYGFYGGNDARVNATVPVTAELMEKAGKTFEPVTYEGAGHGFMRSGAQPSAEPANKNARAEAWERWKNLLGQLP